MTTTKRSKQRWMRSIEFYPEEGEPQFDPVGVGPGACPYAGIYLCQYRGMTDEVQSVGVYRFRYRRREFIDLKTDGVVMVTHYCVNRIMT